MEEGEFYGAKQATTGVTVHNHNNNKLMYASRLCELLSTFGLFHLLQLVEHKKNPLARI